MQAFPSKKTVYLGLWLCVVVTLAGCCNPCCWFPWPKKPPQTAPLGTQSDEIWRRQEAGGSASDFVIYQHEFEINGLRLNAAGEDHVKGIAVRIRAGAPLPVIVERSDTSVNPQSQYKYPVNPNPNLDMQRREMVVKALTAMGIADAEQRVIVAPAIAEGYTGTEAARAYNRGMTSQGNNRARGIGEPAVGQGGALDTGIVTMQ